MKRILVIRLSSLGDLILISPIFQNIKESHPDWHISLLTKDIYQPIFENNPYLDKIIPFEKDRGVISYIKEVRKERYDIIIDLHNKVRSNLIRAFSGAKSRIRYRKDILRRRFMLWGMGKNRGVIPSVVDRYLEPLEEIGIIIRKILPRLYLNERERVWAENLLPNSKGKWIGLNPGARWQTKEWVLENYIELIERLRRKNYNIVLFGDKDNTDLAERIKYGLSKDIKAPDVVDMVGKTSLRQLFALISRCKVLVTTDSGPMHAASALDIPVVAIFGPTVKGFGFFPTGEKSIVLEKELPCRPCSLHGTNRCRRQNKECMERITVDEVEQAIENLLYGGQNLLGDDKVLIIQTAFLGDMVLTLPMIQALKNKAPDVSLNLLSVPRNAGILKENPVIDEIITYDKKGNQKGLIALSGLIRDIKKRNFRLAVIPHRSFKSAFIAWAARIPRRIGFDASQGRIFLTDVVHYDIKKHFLDRCLDLARYIGADTSEKRPLIPISEEDSEFVIRLFSRENISRNDLVIGINPGSVWPTKRWTEDGYGCLSDMLIERDGARIILFGGADDIKVAQRIENLMKHRPINLAGKTSLGQLSAVISKCRIFVTNDTGSMHIAVSLGIPVIAIFGPTTLDIGFGPYGDGNFVVQKEIPCRPCGLHGGYRCKKGTFECMRSITPQEVYTAVKERVYANIAGSR